VQTRADFVRRYMADSGIANYILAGETVLIPMSDDSKLWVKHALECRCGEHGCQGWAMIPNGSQNVHKSQNGLTTMTFEEACSADDAARDDDNMPNDRELLAKLFEEGGEASGQSFTIHGSEPLELVALKPVYLFGCTFHVKDRANINLSGLIEHNQLVWFGNGPGVQFYLRGRSNELEAEREEDG
jgi:hypothetical protein